MPRVGEDLLYAINRENFRVPRQLLWPFRWYQNCPGLDRTILSDTKLTGNHKKLRSFYKH